MKVLIDTNLFLDVVLKREPFVKQSLKVINKLIDDGSAYISVQSLKDIFYWCSKDSKIEEPWLIVEKLSFICNVIDVSSEDSINALMSGVSDYEDGLIAMSAIRNGIDAIVTRDQRGFVDIDIIVFHPKDADKYLDSNQLARGNDTMGSVY